MSRLIGLVTGIYVEEWIEPAIQQALNYCDEVSVSIGAHTPELEVLQDRSLEIAGKYKDRVHIVPTVTKTSHIGAKGPTMNRMIEACATDVGDWIWVLDSDEFYFDQTVRQVREAMRDENVGLISIGAKFFFLNMTRYLISKHNRLFKITHNDAKFKPSGAQSWAGTGSRVHVGMDEDRLGMFHYSLLTSPRYRRLFWQTEKKGQEQSKKILWLDNIYVPFELDREDYWIDKNVELLGLNKRTPIWTQGFHPQPDGTLYQYDGPHPPVIEAAGLHLIEDFRTFRDG